MGYWLLKSDPDTFSWQDLEKSPKRTTRWDGVRNYQARNSLRDDVRKGDGVLFYHSQTDKAVVGTAVVTRAGYPEPDDPGWIAIDVRADRPFSRPVTLEQMRAIRDLSGMVLLQKGSRLSVQPVTAKEWALVTKLGA